ncbi:UvrD-helicase domain-containing protein [Rhodococcus qingshengii]|uniref:UvrD-helicase domain-containing protein n=1 Tax=Rhodococcus qingshengii TaxID=334542 RepID=UPI0035DEFFAC
MKPTEEQADAIRAAARGETFVLDAPAGSGKSSTAERMASVIDGKVMYIVYNRAAKDEAVKRFAHLPHVEVRTTASLGWHAFRRTHAERMNFDKSPRVRGKKVAELEGITDFLDIGGGKHIAPTVLANIATSTLLDFSYTADFVITGKNVKRANLPDGLTEHQEDIIRESVVPLARRIWKKTQEPDSEHWFPQQYAFKLYAMTQPDLKVDAVILDEAQDSNPATEYLVKSQNNAQQIIIGDPAQQIYAWRGAVDIMDNFGGNRYSLTQSFRFGVDIADEAAKWLEHTGTGITIKGLKTIDSRVTDGGMMGPNAILCRTNVGCMASAMEELKKNRRVAIVGGTSGLKDLAHAAGKLMQGKPVEHPELAAFETWDELVEFSEEPSGGDLKPLVALVRSYGPGGIIDACKKMVNEKRGRPDILVSTAHKAKGLEWGKVRVNADFESSEPSPHENVVTGEPVQGKINRMDAMLHYVTVTRAKKHLDRGGLSWIDNYGKTVEAYE